MRRGPEEPGGADHTAKILPLWRYHTSRPPALRAVRTAAPEPPHGI
nr:MAG TPA: hypothetical protein [Caudoviricetes sp.]